MGNHAEEMKVGDVVRLRSGSVNVTVTSRMPPLDAESAAICRCMYFGDGKFVEVMIVESALEAAEDSTPRRHPLGFEPVEVEKL